MAEGILDRLLVAGVPGRQRPAMRRPPQAHRVTSSDAEEDVLQSYSLGANCYVTKPVGLKAFQKIVHTVEGFWFSVVKLPRTDLVTAR